MMRLPLIVLFLLLLCVSCKSHKAIVVRASGPGVPVENSVKLSEAPASDPAFVTDAKIGDALADEARTWIGTPYLFGGESKHGVDCSGMVMVIYNDVASLKLPRNSAAQRDYCLEIPQRNLQPGDLVFFSSSTRGGKVSHVGMYVGGGKIIHASTSKGVIESSLDEKYYKNHYHSAGRVYGVTYAATGEKTPELLPDKRVCADEITLDEFVAKAATKTAEQADTTSKVERQPSAKTEAIKKNLEPDSVSADSVEHRREIRESVKKAMKFGK